MYIRVYENFITTYHCVFVLPNCVSADFESLPHTRNLSYTILVHPPFASLALLTGKYARPSRLIFLAPVVVDVDHEARVGGLVRAREGDELTGLGSARAPANAHLRTRDVELGAPGR